MSTCQKNMFFMSTCQKNMTSCLLVKKTWLHVNHANIVQTVKNCYKIKIYSRESKSRFYGVLLIKQHQCLTIVPLLQYNSATIRV